MIIFSVPLAAPEDPGGWGYWLNSHMEEHRQFTQIIQANQHGAQLPLFDLGVWRGTTEGNDQWMSDHQGMTFAVTQLTGVGDPDFGECDWSNVRSYMVWMNNHAVWHAQQRAKLGIR